MVDAFLAVESGFTGAFDTAAAGARAEETTGATTGSGAESVAATPTIGTLAEGAAAAGTELVSGDNPDVGAEFPVARIPRIKDGTATATTPSATNMPVRRGLSVAETCVVVAEFCVPEMASDGVLPAPVNVDTCDT